MCAGIYRSYAKCISPNCHRNLSHDLISRDHEFPELEGAEVVSRNVSIQAVPGRILEGALAPIAFGRLVLWGYFADSLGGLICMYPSFAQEFGA